MEWPETTTDYPCLSKQRSFEILRFLPEQIKGNLELLKIPLRDRFHTQDRQHEMRFKLHELKQ